MIRETWEESAKALEAGSEMMANSLIAQVQMVRGVDVSDLHETLKESSRKLLASAG